LNKPVVEFGLAVAFSGRLSPLYSCGLTGEGWWNEAKRVNVQSGEVKVRMRPLSNGLRAGYPEMNVMRMGEPKQFPASIATNKSKGTLLAGPWPITI
jgi:hypothetical protein